MTACVRRPWASLRAAEGFGVPVERNKVKACKHHFNAGSLRLSNSAATIAHWDTRYLAFIT